jgi:Rrf2 family iron-sulfur cluster assembly transcriptional regulator
MKLSTKSRYGTRLLVDMAQHAGNGPLHLSDIAQRQGISVKYLEQIIIPLRKAGYIEGVRGPQGGHTLAKPPGEIRIGEVVALLEEGDVLVECVADASVCDRVDTCITRFLWKEAAQAMYAKLNSYTLADLAAMSRPENEIRK